MAIRNPVEWGADQMMQTARAIREAASTFQYVDESSPPRVRRITLMDIKEALKSGLRDCGTYRSDVLFLCLIFPLIGIVLGVVTVHFGVLPLVFPLISGFALIGPFAAGGLYEMSRRQEQGKPVSWVDAFGVFGSPSFAAIIKLGLLLLAIFLVWLAVALLIYRLTLGPLMPTSPSAFANDVFTTRVGWTLIGVGVSVGFLFALLVLAISVVSFPLLLDRPVRITTAMRTSIQAVLVNPVPMLTWGLIVAASLILGAIPVLIGLIVVMPVLGHATWHLYRRVVD